MQLDLSKRVDFPNLPHLYSRSGRQDSASKYKTDGVNHFFENLIGHVNRPRPHGESLPVLRRDKGKEVYDPNAPLITSDIYVSKPPKFKSSVQTDVERVKEHLSRISGLYKEVIVYKKPKIMPLIPLPEFRHQKKIKKLGVNEEGQDIDEISDEELLPWDFTNGPGYKPKNKRGSNRKLSKRSIKTQKSNKQQRMKPIKQQVAPSKGINLDNAWKEFKMVTKYIMFTNWIFRLYRYQINKCYTRVNDYLKEKYPICMEEIRQRSFEIVKPQMIKTWLAIFSESSINIVIDKQMLFTYNLIEEDELKVPFTQSEKEEYIRSYQPYADEVHVALCHLEISDRPLDAVSRQY